MKNNKLLTIFLSILLISCNKKVDEFELLNEKVEKHYKNLSLSMQTSKDDDCLNGIYNVSYLDNKYEINYQYESFNEISLENTNRIKNNQGSYIYQNDNI